MELSVPEVDELVVMAAAQVEVAGQQLELVRRRAEAASALMVQRVDETSTYALDGHRRVSAWGKATNNWSGAEAAHMVKLARAMASLPRFALAALAGHLSVSAMHAIAAVAANPRVREHLADADELFTTSAIELPFDDLVVLLRHWEELADADGARDRHDRAIHDRRAALRIVGERGFLEASGPAYDASVFDEVFTAFVDLEFQIEWHHLATVHGDRMCAALMERTHSQRCYDALQRLFAAAAGSTELSVRPTVDIVIDQVTFEHQLAEMLGGDPDPIPPSHAAARRCEDAQGRVIDPRAAVTASIVGHARRLVLGADGVALDMGRRQRLFTGALREAVLLSARRCGRIGCGVPGHRCEADHLVPAALGGATSAANGGPACGHDNRFKNRGFRTLRDAKGRYHTYRPDGTEIGWPVFVSNVQHLASALAAQAELGP